MEKIQDKNIFKENCTKCGKINWLTSLLNVGSRFKWESCDGQWLSYLYTICI